MITSRRRFITLLGGAAVGSIFVPRFERWFRPNAIAPLGWPPQLVQYELGWTSHFDAIYSEIRAEYNAMLYDAVLGWRHPHGGQIILSA